MRALIIEKRVQNLKRLTTCSSYSLAVSLRTDLPATHLSAKSGHFGAERVPERSQRSPMVQMKAESKTFDMAYHKIWIHILGYD